MFLLLAGATIVSVAVWRVRSEYSGSEHYAFLIWNLFLAWIPFIIAYFTYALTLNRRQLYFIIPVAAFFWLLFFPNALYILDRFPASCLHIQKYALWYDVMLLIWFSFTGLLLGMVSLFLMQGDDPSGVRQGAGMGLRCGGGRLGSAGVYAGRFLHWNSWDIFNNLPGMAQDTIQTAQDPSLQSIGFISLFTAFFLFLYITLYTFGHLCSKGGSTRKSPCNLCQSGNLLTLALPD